MILNDNELQKLLLSLHLSKTDPIMAKYIGTHHTLDINSFKRTPYVAVVGAIIGQIYTLNKAREVRRKLFQLLSSDFTQEDIYKTTDEVLLFTGMTQRNLQIIRSLHNIPLHSKDDI